MEGSSKKNILAQCLDKYKNSDIMYRAGLWFFLITVLDRAISVITQPVINRVLTVEQVGVFNVYSSWQSIFSVITTLNLFYGVLEIYVTKYKEDKKQVISSLMVLCTLSFSVCAALMFIIYKPVSWITDLKPVYIFLMMLSVISTAVIQFWCVPKRFEYAYKKYAALVVPLFVIKCVLSVVLSILIRKDRVFGRILGLVLPDFIVAVFLFLLMLRHTQWKRITCYWKPALAYNIPLIPHYLSSILLASSDRIMIQKMCGEYEAGLYSVVYSYSSLCLMVFTSLNSAYTPFAYNAIMKKEYDALSKKTNILLVVSVFFALLFSAVAPEAILVLGGSRYLEAADIIPVLIAGIFFSSFYAIFSNVAFVYEITKWIFPITLCGSVLNIILNYIFLPIYGYKVAAYTTVVGYLIIALLHAAVAYRIVKKDIYNLKFIIFLMSIFILICVTIIKSYALNWMIRYIIYFLGLLVFFVLLFTERKIRKENRTI